MVCALYVPGVAFGDIDKLRPVTLTEMNYSKYGAKASVKDFELTLGGNGKISERFASSTHTAFEV